MDKKNEEKKSTTKLAKIGAIIFAIDFVGTIVFLMAFSGKFNPILKPLAFGQLFTVASIIFFSEREMSLSVLAHLTVGLMFVIGPLIANVGPRLSDIGLIDKIKFIISGILIVAGYVLIILSRKEKFFKKAYPAAVISFAISLLIVITFCVK